MARKPTAKKKPTKASVKAAADRAEKRAKGEKVEPETPIGPLNPPETAGRPAKYKAEFANIAKKLCERGATDAELAEIFDVTTVTIWRWQCEHEEFCNALKAGKEIADDRVERSLYQRAVGYSYSSEKLFSWQGDVTRAPCMEHVPPDPGAAKLWLTNRRPKQWREKTEVKHDASGAFAKLWQAVGSGAIKEGAQP